MTNEHYTALEQIWDEVFALKNGYGNPLEIAKKIENSIGRGYRLTSFAQSQNEDWEQEHDDIHDILRDMGMNDDDTDMRQLK